MVFEEFFNVCRADQFIIVGYTDEEGEFVELAYGMSYKDYKDYLRNEVEAIYTKNGQIYVEIAVGE